MSGDSPSIISLEEAWPWLIAECPPAISGRPASFDEVQSEIDAGRAVVLSNSDGILLLALEPGLKGEGDTLIVWCAVSFRSGAAALVDRYLPDVERWASEMGARRVTLQSPRCGWLRRLPERWRVTNVTYELEVANVEPK